MDLNKNNKDDLAEIRDGVLSFIEGKETLHDAVISATAWLKGELAGIPAAAQDVFQAAVQQAKGDGNRPLGEIVADTLTILFNDGHSIYNDVAAEVIADAKAIKSSVVEAVVGLTTQAPAK